MNILAKKILLIGDVDVGKTSILTRYFNNNFSEVTESTIGIEFKTKMFIRDNLSIKLQIWDTSGQERFKSITQNYFRDADGLLYVFDVTNENSFKSIENWLKMSNDNNNKDFIKILIGNKTDLEGRSITKEEMEKFKNENRMDKLFEISAKDNKNISEMFEIIVDLLIGKNTLKNIDVSNIPEVNNQNEGDKGICNICSPN